MLVEVEVLVSVKEELEELQETLVVLEETEAQLQAAEAVDSITVQELAVVVEVSEDLDH